MIKNKEKLNNYINKSIEQFDYISDERKRILKLLSNEIKNLILKKNIINLTFICTHNSRRSHLSQLWAQTAACFYKIDNIHCFSGGTEITAFDLRAVSTIKRTGFDVIKTENTKNPRYLIHHLSKKASEHYSKIFNEEPNPQKNFIAIMTCGEADKKCPVTFGYSKKFIIKYNDPKSFDGTEKEANAYDNVNRMISREQLFVFYNINKQNLHL